MGFLLRRMWIVGKYPSEYGQYEGFYSFQTYDRTRRGALCGDQGRGGRAVRAGQEKVGRI